uniref:Uncharacterized protein n=1 Tax=Rhodnius prolixus TaxID=13249 RepID=T1HRI2_RHOPR
MMATDFPDRREVEPDQALTCVSVMDSILDQVTVYQLGRGVPRENYSYMTLMSAMMTMVGRAVHAVFSLVLALAPITEIALHVLRFTLEKFSEISRTQSKQELSIKVCSWYF